MNVWHSFSNGIEQFGILLIQGSSNHSNYGFVVLGRDSFVGFQGFTADAIHDENGFGCNLIGNAELCNTRSYRHTVEEGECSFNKIENGSFPSGNIFAKERKTMWGIGFSALVSECGNLTEYTSLG